MIEREVDLKKGTKKLRVLEETIRIIFYVNNPEHSHVYAHQHVQGALARNAIRLFNCPDLLADLTGIPYSANSASSATANTSNKYPYEIILDAPQEIARKNPAASQEKDLEDMVALLTEDIDFIPFNWLGNVHVDHSGFNNPIVRSFGEE